jgi:hypothetical protein
MRLYELYTDSEEIEEGDESEKTLRFLFIATLAIFRHIDAVTDHVAGKNHS